MVIPMRLLQPVLSPERALQQQDSRSMQLRFCHPASATLCCQQGAGSTPSHGRRWGRRAARGEFGTIQICRVCVRLVPPLLMPQASIKPGFLLVSGEAARLVIAMRLERLGEDQGPDPLCVQCCDLLPQALAPADPTVPSAFISHVASAGKIEPSGKVTEGKCSEKSDFQVLPVWDRSPQPDPFLTESTGSKYRLFKRQI